MGAGEGVYVVHIKLAIAWSVEGPGAVVADQPPGALRGGGGWLGGLGWLLGGGVGGLVAHAVQPVPRPVALLQLGVERGAGRTLVLLRVPASAHVSRDKLTTSVTSIIQPPWPSGVHRKYPSGHVSGSGWNSESRQSSSVGVLQANSGEIIQA